MTIKLISMLQVSNTLSVVDNIPTSMDLNSFIVLLTHDLNKQEEKIYQYDVVKIYRVVHEKKKLENFNLVAILTFAIE